MSSFSLNFKGSHHLKQRLILATISGKSVKITDIRNGEGIQEFEINAIRLIDKLTNGTHVKLSPTGTELEFTPGILHGGKIEHSCCVEKSIGMIEDFCKFSFFSTPS
jgi:RNA 3'-terminal phosphate cyclase